MRKPLFLIPSICICFSCSLLQPSKGNIGDLLPRETDVPGWNRLADPVISEHGGHAVQYDKGYTGTGITAYARNEYSNRDNADKKIVLEIFRFSSNLDAFGFFSGIRGFNPSEKADTVKNEFATDTLLIKRKGEYVLFAHTGSDEFFLKADLKQFIRISESYLGGNFKTEALPAEMKILSENNENNIIYRKKPLENFPGINNVYYSRWLTENGYAYIFISRRESFYDAYNLFNSIIKNSRFIIIEADNRQAAFVKEKDSNYSFISFFDNWIAGCWSCSGFREWESILPAVHERILRFEKKNKINENRH